MQPINVMIRGAGVVVGLGVGISMGCLNVRPNPDHCALLDGDQSCAERHPGERTFCARGTCGPTLGRDGCVDERPEDDTCYSPCGGGLSFTDDSACLGGSSTSTGEESTGTESSSGGSSSGESSTTGPLPCMGNEDCPDATAPFCEPSSGECVACDATAIPDAACAELDPTAPLCVEGACVQCTSAATEACVGETPVCDDATNTCVPCDAHDQCGEAACNLFTGACLPADAVVHVGPGEEFATLTLALGSFAAGAEGTIVVHDASYDESATVAGNRVLAFLANGSDVPRWIRSAGSAPQLTVAAGSTVLMDGVQVSGNASSAVPGLLVDGGRTWVDRGRIVTNLGGGIVAQAGAELVLRNCFVGGSINNEATVSVNGSTAMVLYSTLAAGFGAATAMTCDGAATVEARNSLLVAEAASNEIECSGIAVDHCAVEMNLGGTNTSLGDMNTAWFVDYSSGDLHLAATPPIAIATTARWEDGDPPIDIDGAARPQLDGAPDVAGADVP